MAIAARALADTRQAFDSVASSYAASNEANPLLRVMRGRTLAKVFDHVPPGSHLLDLGCGPGTDDELLGRAGYRVTAIDSSRAMVAEARQRIETCGLAPRVAVYHAGIDDLGRFAGVTFDAVLSDFGPLNCVPDLEAVAPVIAARLRSGGMLIASVIGRVCPWELAIYLLRGRIDRALLRFNPGMAPVPLNGRTVWTRYYSPRQFETLFAAAGFIRVSVESLGLFSPPPYLEHVAARHPALVRRLERLDDRLGSRWPFRAWGDHFLIVLRKG